MRLFIALDLPKIQHLWLKDRTADFRRAFAASELRWTPLDQWHVTLRFLGECQDHRLALILRAIKEAARETRPFEMTLGKPGTFSGPRMGVLWVGVDFGVEPIKELAHHLNKHLEKANFSIDKRVLRPHVTLARGRQKISAASLRELPAGPICPKTSIDSLNLYQSTLTPSGAIYTLIHSSSLLHPAAKEK